MPDITPTSYLGLCYKYLKDTLASSSSWQTLCGVSTPANALARIFIGDQPAASVSLPFCILCEGRDNTTTVALGEVTHSGRIKMVFQFVPSGTPAELSAIDTIANIKGQMEALAGTPGYIDARYDMEQEPLPSEETEGESTAYFQAILTASWGGGGGE